MRLLTYFLPLIALLFMACNRPAPTDQWDLSRAEADSLRFIDRHHYTKGYSFEVVADSLTLQATSPYQPLQSIGHDGGVVHQGERVIVLDILWPMASQLRHSADSTISIADSMLTHPDSIWICVGNERLVRGWIAQPQLLGATVPTSPISRFIYTFSRSSSVILFGILALGLIVFYSHARRSTRWYCLHVRDVASFYPTLFVLIFSATATLYGTLQAFAPDLWQHFYYYPTLNPFGQPTLIAGFLTGFWALVIVGVAMIDDLRHRIYTTEVIVYLLTLSAVCALLYLVFTLTPHIYIAYPLLLLYWGYALRSLRQKYHWLRPHYRCGHCSRRLPQVGICPHCGADNQ